MRRVSGFTLVELLVVIAIMVIIMGFSVPMFSKMSFGNAVDGASRMISSQLSLARAEAVAQRKYIAIIMPGEKFNQPLNDANGDYHYRAFRAAIVKEKSGSDNTYEFDEWFPGTEWGFIPNGAVIAETDEDGVNEDTEKVDIECVEEYEDKTYDGVKRRELKKRYISEKWLKHIKLDGDNEITKVCDGDKNHKMVVWQEVENGELKTKSRDNTEVRAIIFQPNGRVVGECKFVTIAEGVPTEVDSGYNLVNGSKGNGNIGNKNIRIMKINQYTGKISYLDIYDNE